MAGHSVVLSTSNQSKSFVAFFDACPKSGRKFPEFSMPGAIQTLESLRARSLDFRDFRRLLARDVPQALDNFLPAWAGFIAYTKPDTNFGETIECRDSGMDFDYSRSIRHVLRVPVEYRNEKNALLTVKLDFTNGQAPVRMNIEEKGNVKTVEFSLDSSKVEFHPNFPKTDGDYLTNEDWVVVDKQVHSSHPQVSCLYREDNAFVGLRPADAGLSNNHHSVGEGAHMFSARTHLWAPFGLLIWESKEPFVDKDYARFELTDKGAKQLPSRMAEALAR